MKVLLLEQRAPSVSTKLDNVFCGYNVVHLARNYTAECPNVPIYCPNGGSGFPKEMIA